MIDMDEARQHFIAISECEGDGLALLVACYANSIFRWLNEHTPSPGDLHTPHFIRVWNEEKTKATAQLKKYSLLPGAGEYSR